MTKVITILTYGSPSLSRPETLATGKLLKTEEVTKKRLFGKPKTETIYYVELDDKTVLRRTWIKKL